MGPTIPLEQLIPLDFEQAIAGMDETVEQSREGEPGSREELEIPELDPDRAFEWSPALFGARAAVLEDLGRHDEAAFWTQRAEVAAFRFRNSASTRSLTRARSRRKRSEAT